MNYSPLRYPGGKSKIAPLIRTIMQTSNNTHTTYIEPFAGGSGVALNLLLEGYVNHIVINDYDKAIYSFWRALKDDPWGFLELLDTTPLSIDEWQRQKEIYTAQNKRYSLELGFSAFYLNRTNRSGILSAGPIGGYAQTGSYDISARFNRAALTAKIQDIIAHRNQIDIYNKEVRSFIQRIIPQYNDQSFVYFDPPYFINGQRLYKNALKPADHADIAQHIMRDIVCDWVITYDDVPQLREIYAEYPQRSYTLNYSAANKGKGAELIVFSSPDLLPTQDAILDSMGDFELTIV